MLEMYVLKHKDEKCGLVSIETGDGSLDEYLSANKNNAPFLGNDTRELMKKWWMARCVPATRKAMYEAIRLSGCDSAGEYLAKNLALSMTDCYWICPIDADLKWADVNLRVSGKMMGGKIPYHNATSYDPNASLGGQMEKYWDLTGPVPLLVKTAGMHYGQQAINELFATIIHEKQGCRFPYVEYRIRETEDGDIQSVCAAFTSEKAEFLPAMEVLDSEKTSNDEALYDAYIRICSEHGIDCGYISDYMDYQTLSDFVISNTDEHLMNFGIIRDPDSLRFTEVAPIFDSGNSMFYSDTRRAPYERYELLERQITSFHRSEEAMLKHVKNKNVLKEDLLPSAKEVKMFYESNGIPENKAGFISSNYEKKVQMLKEFQKGKTISLYKEKKAFREARYKKPIAENT